MWGRSEFHYSLAVRVFVSIYLSIVITVGVVGNAIVCVIFGLSKELHTSINMLIVNLAIADILQSLNMIFMVISINNGTWTLGQSMCEINGFVTIAFIVTSLISLFLISINRYIKICQPTKQNMFSKKVALYSIIAAWVIPAFLGLGPILGWSKYMYRPGKVLCTIKFNYNFSYTVTIMSAAILIPFIGICYCYFKIISTIRESRNRVFKPSTSTGYIQSYRKESRIALMLGVVMVSFATFYMPSSISNFYEMAQGTDYNLPVSLDLFSVLLAMVNHANNPIIYGLMNKNFRKPFEKLFCRQKSNIGRMANQNQVCETQLQSSAVL